MIIRKRGDSAEGGAVTSADEHSIVVINFGTAEYSGPSAYALRVPQAGTYVVLLRSDDSDFHPDFGNVGATQSTLVAGRCPYDPSSELCVYLSLGPHAAAVLAPAADPPSSTARSGVPGAALREELPPTQLRNENGWPEQLEPNVLGVLSIDAGARLLGGLVLGALATVQVTATVGVLYYVAADFFARAGSPRMMNLL